MDEKCALESASDKLERGYAHSENMIRHLNYDVCLYCVGSLMEKFGEMVKNGDFDP